MSTRKRTRDSSLEDSEEDELSPTKARSIKGPSSAIKKRKLNTYASSPALRNPTPKRGFLGRVSGLFGYGKSRAIEKENVPAEAQDEEELDELGEAVSEMADEDIWDVPDEDAPVLHPRSNGGKGRPSAWTRSAPEKVDTIEDSEDSGSESVAEAATVRKLARVSARGSITNGTKSVERRNTSTAGRRGKSARNARIEGSDDSSSADEPEFATPLKPKSRSAASSVTRNGKSAQKEKKPSATLNPGRRKEAGIEIKDSNSEDSEDAEPIVPDSRTPKRRPVSKGETRSAEKKQPVRKAPRGRPKKHIEETTTKEREAKVTPRRGRGNNDPQEEIQDSDAEMLDVEDSTPEEVESEIVVKGIRRSNTSSVTKPVKNRVVGSSPKKNQEKDTEMPVVSQPKAKRGRPRKSLQTENTTPKESNHKTPKFQEAIIASPRRSSGRPRKSDILKKVKQLSREGARKRLFEGVDDDNDVAHEIEVEEEFYTPKTHIKGRPLKRGVDILINSTNFTPKGILTPTRKGDGPRPRKSVVFEDVAESDLGFRDLPKSATKKLAVTEEEIASEEELQSNSSEEAEDVDEDACAICEGFESKRPNLMILCDGCDMAVHQLCYGVPKVPKGKWFCKKCVPKEDPMELDDVEIEEAATELPDIDGFEDHLYAMQGLLLEKVTGNRRIKLHGHDEEMEKVHQVVKQTVLAGEGNSMLVIGARGSGKTTVG